MLSSAFLAFGLYHIHSLSGVTEGGVIADLAHGADGGVGRDDGAVFVAADTVDGDADGLGPAFLCQTGILARVFVDISRGLFTCSHRVSPS